MDKNTEHAEKALACIDKMKEGLSELVWCSKIQVDFEHISKAKSRTMFGFFFAIMGIITRMKG